MQHNRSRDQDLPNRAANKEPAEGSRETVQNSEPERSQPRTREQPGRQPAGEPGKDQAGGTGGGITNRDLEREQSEQEQLPPRGRSKPDR